jgi:aminoglycoside phosphotransferase (APT) family kinase protein
MLGRMSFISASALAHLLPEKHIGKVTQVQPISIGQSGARVYAISSGRGELILRINAALDEPAHWTQQLTIMRRAAECGVAPAIVYVDEAAHAVVTERVAGIPLAAALGDPEQRDRAIASIIDQLRRLHTLDASGIEERDPIAYVRSQHATQRLRPGFPAWAGALEPILDALGEDLARDTRRVVSHNDLNPGNILWDGKLAWLVDWEVAGLSHPFYDFAVLAMFLQLPDPAARRLLALQEQRPLDEREHTTFAGLRQLAALLCGTVLTGLVPDLSVLPEPAPSLSDVYAAMLTGKLDFQTPYGRGAFAMALLRLGTRT